MGSTQAQFAMPQNMVLDEATATEKYGKFIAEPFEKGFGHTLGNGLRRVLLHSLEGVAVTWIKIDGVLHEYAQAADVVEDVTEIVLNFKNVRFTAEGDLPRKLELRANTKGPVTAADIVTDGVTQVVNPEQYICTLDKDTPLRIEFEVASGRGWKSADDNKPSEAPIGLIPVDSLFSPIERVSYDVSDTRVGQMTDYDKLELEIWTDGRISPEDALRKSAIILRDHLCVFTDDNPEDSTASLIQTPEDEAILSKMLIPVTSVELSVRAQNCLRNAEIKYLGELIQKSESEMLKYRNFGKKSLDEIKDKMLEMGITLNMKLKDEVRVAFNKKLEKEEMKSDAS
ncbi:DNA-directed RNA polymerase subunit alpha [Lentisphaera araneosa HTCC2155]|jgi:DNA-directed RNA polymerase subunit alpha|uniref:DNA-directed RNA polymerase subunit alpha n=1 Tax=Lentisphaera araneosa HTCC2155 TaxID=313628 RepID=A6DLN7_9BACT|nr:DNA-directed RNA polymerase subunit alpha [Lentisphaera araneosa]EDM27492.1 DNA-directed RNA polymerase subunit alpha [Lentisphaera araneosa HTCC2155]